MTEMKQPHALALAEINEQRGQFVTAAELRRLHAENSAQRAELVAEAARTAEATLRANQAQDQHRMQCNMRDQGWQPIESAPKEGRTMYVVRGFGITDKNVHCRNYTTDPYCVWPGDDGGWVRWPHAFPPTHWMPLPKPPAM